MSYQEHAAASPPSDHPVFPPAPPSPDSVADEAAALAPHKPRTGFSRYDRDFAVFVCERISSSPQSLARICRAPDMPGIATIYRWLGEYPEFAEMYAVAKQTQAEILLEDALELVDDDSADVPERHSMKRCQMRVDFRKWMASKLLPRKYGDRRDHTPIAARPGVHLETGAQVTMPESLRLQLIEQRRLLTERPPDGNE